MAMRRLALWTGLAMTCSPALATQGMVCEGQGASVDLLYGHAAVPGLLEARLQIGDKVVPTAIAQSWSGENDTMIDLADPDQMAVISKIRLKWARQTWRGTLTYNRRTYVIRCGEAG